MQTVGSSLGYWQVINNLLPNTTYTFSGFLRAEAVGNTGYLYAKDFGGTTVKSATFGGTTYGQVTITFTTGASNTSSQIGVWRDASMGNGVLHGDDFVVTRN